MASKRDARFQGVFDLRANENGFATACSGFRGYSFTRLAGAAGDGDPPALAVQSFGGRPTEAARGTGHEANFACDRQSFDLSGVDIAPSPVLALRTRVSIIFLLIVRVCGDYSHNW
jgi:hypothetical protein